MSNVFDLQKEYNVSRAALNFIGHALFGRDLMRQSCHDQMMTVEEDDRIREVLKRHVDEEIPLGYLLKQEMFYGLRFYVDERVLIPRPETELLVETALRMIEDFPQPSLRIVDLCSGSGNVGISLVKNNRSSKKITLFFADRYRDTFAVVRKNAALHRISDYHCLNADLLEGCTDACFDMIVANPPYVEESFIRDSRELFYEPPHALNGGPDGLAFCRLIIRQAKRCLTDPGRLLMEISEKDSGSLEDLARDYFQTCVIQRDYAGKPRILITPTNHG